MLFILCFFLAMRAPLKLINVYSLFLGTRIHVFLYSVSMLSFKISQWFWAFFTDVCNFKIYTQLILKTIEQVSLFGVNVKYQSLIVFFDDLIMFSLFQVYFLSLLYAQLNLLIAKAYISKFNFYT